MSSTDVNNLVDKLAKTTVESDNELSFAGKGLKLDSEELAREIVDGIKSFQDMVALRLEGNTLGVEAAKAIEAALAVHPEFKKAYWSDLFTGRLKTEIPQALQHLGSGIITAGATLTVLDLSDNAFGPNGLVGIKDFIKSTSCFKLQELKLNNNGLGIFGGRMLAESLMECHKASVEAGSPFALKTLIVGRNRLENEGAKALSETFKAIRSLERLEMPQNGILTAGVTALAEAVAYNTNLHTLNLNDNTFTSKGGEAMAKALPNLQNLEVINFGDCLLRTGGALAIAQHLKEGHTKLRELILSGNEIKKDGGIAIAEAMENKINLQTLELGANNLGEDGVDTIQEKMAKYDRSEKLASLSDDEGEDSDEEEEDEEGEESEEEPEENEDGEISTDPALQVHGKAIQIKDDEEILCTARDFLQFPSSSKLLGIGKNRAELIGAELGDNIEDVDDVMKVVIKISSVVTMGDEKVLKAATECVDYLLKDLVEHGDESIHMVLSNSILVHLGLLKGENKKFVPSKDLTGPLIVLEHIVRQSYFVKSSRDILQLFLSRSTPALDAVPKPRHHLLQTLYTF